MIDDYLQGARRVTDGVYSGLRVRKDYSYSMDSFWRPGIVLVGDAACFIDPVISTGVHLATYSGLLAARSVNSCLDGGLDETRSFTEFDGRYRREYRLLYEFLVAFCDMQAHEDSYFWQAKKVSKIEGAELEAFALLVGGTTAEAGLLLNSASHQLSDAVDNEAAKTMSGEQRGTALFATPVVTKVRREMRQLQISLNGSSEKPPPLRLGGLVPSSDHLRWTESAPVAARASSAQDSPGSRG